MANEGTSSSRSPKQSPVATRRRITQACINCKRQKLKCSGETPCERCSKNDLVCEYECASVSVRADMMENYNARLSRIEDAVNHLQTFVNSQNANSTSISTPSISDNALSLNPTPAPIAFLSSESIFLSLPDPHSAGILTLEEIRDLQTKMVQRCGMHAPSPLQMDLHDLLANHKLLITATCTTAVLQDGHNFSETTRQRLLQLMESFVGATMSNTEHRLSDVAGLLVLSCWETDRAPRGQQRWLLLSHAYRIMTLLQSDTIRSTTISNSQQHPSYIPPPEILWNWWLQLALSCQDCLNAFASGLPMITADPQQDFRADVFHRLVRQIQTKPNGYLDFPTVELATMTVACYEMIKVARLYLPVANQMAAWTENDDISCWLSWCQQLLNIVQTLDRWHQIWLAAGTDQLGDIGNGQTRLKIIYHYLVLCITDRIFQTPLILRNIDLPPQHEVVVTNCLSLVETSSGAIIANAIRLLDEAKLTWTPDCFMIAVCRAASMSIMLARTPVCDIVKSSTKGTLLQPHQAAQAASTAIQFLESYCCSERNLPAQLALEVRQLAQSLHINLASTEQWQQQSQLQTMISQQQINPVPHTHQPFGLQPQTLMHDWDSRTYQNFESGLDSTADAFPQ